MSNKDSYYFCLSLLNESFIIKTIKKIFWNYEPYNIQTLEKLKSFYRMIYVSKCSLYVSLKYFDYSHNGNKIDNLLYAIMTCQVQLIFPCDWNFFFKKELDNCIHEYRTTQRLTCNSWNALHLMQEIYVYVWQVLFEIIPNELPVFPVGMSWWTL